MLDGLPEERAEAAGSLVDALGPRAPAALGEDLRAWRAVRWDRGFLASISHVLGPGELRTADHGGARQWRTGRLDLVLAGNFDLI